MIDATKIDLANVVLSLSDALDTALPGLRDHHHRVAYIALRIADAVDYPRELRNDLLYASALHGAALVGIEEAEEESVHGSHSLNIMHAEQSARMLDGFPLFREAARVVRYHNVPWAHGKGETVQDVPVPRASHILRLADWIESAIEMDVPILRQRAEIVQTIRDMGEAAFPKELISAFVELSKAESFWLDTVNRRVYSLLLGLRPTAATLRSIDEVNQVASVFAQIIDFKSRFTATHSTGVAVTASELAKRMHFPPPEQKMMAVGGLLHDLGKLAVPVSILNKPGKLEPAEFEVMRAHPYHTFHILRTVQGLGDVVTWASFHHERLDGKGYPFHLDDEGLTLGTRIMAVADVFTALAEDRPYRPGMAEGKIRAILQDMAGVSLDRDVTDIALENLDDIRGATLKGQQAAEKRYEFFAAAS